MKVFLTEHIHPKALALLQSKVQIISDPARQGEADGILTRNLTVDRTWIEGSPSLKVIGIHGTGRDGVDLQAAAERGITVVYVPQENAESVAELIVALTLNLARKVHLADRLLLAGKPLSTAPSVLQGMELSGKVFGMIGCGDIALRAARKLQNGLGMRVIGFSPSLTEEKAKTLGIGYCPDIPSLFAAADVVNIGVHLTPQTHRLITARELSFAKPHCLLINTARGEVVCEEDLFAALQEGVIGAAACDVFATEPPALDNPLLGLPNFLATPHIGANTDEALERVGCSVVTQILDVLEGRTPSHTYTL